MGQPIPVSQIMHSGLLLQCSPETVISEAAARMAENSVSSILISQDNTVVGIWTERDALAINFADPDQFSQPVRSVMRSPVLDRKSTRLNSSHVRISYAVFCLKKKKYLKSQH